MAKTPAISVVSTAFRPGGIDILLAGMSDQIFKDFEVVLVDRLYARRHDRVMQMAQDYGVRLIHVPEHRRNGKWISYCCAWNTGFAVARGTAILILGDWMYAPPGWIERHTAALEGRKRYVVGSYAFLSMPSLALKRPYDFETKLVEWRSAFRCTDESEVMSGGILDDVDVFQDGRFHGSWVDKLPASETLDVRLGYRSSAGSGMDPGWLHVKNDAVYRSILLDIGGLDERLERGRGPMDIDVQLRLEQAGVELWWDPDVVVYYIDPHYILPTLPYGAMDERLEDRWSWQDGLSYVTRRRAEIAFGGAPVAKNNYSLSELSSRLEAWRRSDVQPVSREVTDIEYWGRPIWPDSL